MKRKKDILSYKNKTDNNGADIETEPDDLGVERPE